ncbi:MAG: MFS transporter [Myxococcales bacterium]|nr:MFS transporter [Myxococcales bacterium]
MVSQFVSAGSQIYVAGVFLKPMTEDLGWNRAEFTYGQTLGRFVMAGIGLFIGTLVDRGHARSMMLAGTTVLGIGLWLTSVVSELWQFVLLRGAVVTTGAALIGNLVVNVTLSKWWVQKRGRMVGIASMGVSAAGVVLPPIMTALVDRFGWRAGWQVLAVLALLATYPAALLMRSRPEDSGLNPDGHSDEEMASALGDAARADYLASLTRGQALRTVAFYQIVVAFGFATIGLGTMLFTTIPFTTDAGFNRSSGALMLSVLALPAALSKPVWGLWMDRFPPKALAATSFAIAAIATIVVVLAAQAQHLPWLAVGFALVGWGLGGQIPIQEVIWASYFGRRHLGAVRSVAMPFALFFGAGGPLVVQYYHDRVGDYTGAFYGIAALWLLAGLLVLPVRAPRLVAIQP